MTDEKQRQALLYRILQQLERLTDRQDRLSDLMLAQERGLQEVQQQVHLSEVHLMSELQNLHRDLVNEADPSAKKKRPMSRLARKRWRNTFLGLTTLLLIFEVLSAFFIH